jgi:hypothetical protein
MDIIDATITDSWATRTLSYKEIPDTCKSEKDISHLLNIDSRIRLYNFILSPFKEEIHYIPTKKYIYIPYGFPSISHQVAHMVEMNNQSRLTKYDWGFRHIKYTKDSIGNIGEVVETQSFITNVISREVRVRAIQNHLEKKKRNHSTLVDNTFLYSLATTLSSFGRFKTEKDVFDWIQYLHDRTYNAWSTDKIEYVWSKQLEHIFNWMETS